MGNLILLNELRNERLNAEYNRNDNKHDELIKIIKGLFMLKNNKPLIDLLNEIYDDNLRYDINLKYEDNIHLNELEDIIFLADNDSATDIVDNYTKYRIQFEISNDKQVSVTILKYNLDNGRVTGLNPYVIMISSEINICDIYKLKLIFNKRKLSYRARVFKNWQYNFKQLYENNMYILYPLKVFELEKRLLELKEEIDKLGDDIQDLPKKTKILNLMKDESKEFFRNMNMYLEKIKTKKSLSDEDIREFNNIAISILKNFYCEVDYVLSEIDEELNACIKE